MARDRRDADPHELRERAAEGVGRVAPQHQVAKTRLGDALHGREQERRREGKPSEGRPERGLGGARVGHGEVVSLAEARGANAPVLQVVGNAETVGRWRARTRCSVSPATRVRSRLLPDLRVTRAVTASGGVGTAPAARSDAAAARAGKTNRIGAPSAGDVALWTSGNPASASALASGQALALGSLQAGGSPIALEYAGSLELDLTRAAFSPRSTSAWRSSTDLGRGAAHSPPICSTGLGFFSSSPA